MLTTVAFASLSLTSNPGIYKKLVCDLAFATISG